VVGPPNCKGKTACVERSSPQVDPWPLGTTQDGTAAEERDAADPRVALRYSLLLAAILKSGKMSPTWQTAKKNMFGMEEGSGLNPVTSQAPTQLLAHPRYRQRDRGDTGETKVRKFGGGDKDSLIGEEKEGGNLKEDKGSHTPPPRGRGVPSWPPNNGHLGSQNPAFFFVYPSLC